MSPTSSRKRLIPYLFCWSQNLLDIILIHYLSKTNPVLWSIRNEHLGDANSQFEADAEESVRLMVDWITDLKGLCPIASWCFGVLRPLLGLGGDEKKRPREMEDELDL